MSCKYSERIVFGFLHFQINHYNVHAIIFCIIHLDVYLLELKQFKIKLDGSDSNGYTLSRKSSVIFQPSFAELIITASSGTYWSIRGLNGIYIVLNYSKL
jgi:hypothetical protein